jgi:hypothetical protein
MNKWDVLRQRCPRLYKKDIIFECADGWFELIQDLSIKIENLLEEYAEKYPIVEGEENQNIEMFAVQVKEKYGTLRFYMCCETDEMWDLIEEAESLSAEICELCGNPGKMRGSKWYLVRCDNCYV